MPVVERMWRLYHTPHGKKMFRYTMVSVISSAVSFIILGLAYGVFRWWSEVPDTMLANIVATVPSYYLNRSWAWGKTGRSHVRREILPFWTLSVAGILLSIVAASKARDVGLAHHLSHADRTGLVLGANLLAFGVLWVLKFAVFNRLFHIARTDEEDSVPAETGRVVMPAPSGARARR